MQLNLSHSLLTDTKASPQAHEVDKLNIVSPELVKISQEQNS